MKKSDQQNTHNLPSTLFLDERGAELRRRYLSEALRSLSSRVVALVRNRTRRVLQHRSATIEDYASAECRRC